MTEDTKDTSDTNITKSQWKKNNSCYISSDTLRPNGLKWVPHNKYWNKLSRPPAIGVSDSISDDIDIKTAIVIIIVCFKAVRLNSKQ